jgi:putative hydrolase of the HAD superfamily
LNATGTDRNANSFQSVPAGLTLPTVDRKWLLNSFAMTVLFDFGGTLDYPRHWLDRFHVHYSAAGLNLTRLELEPAFDAATRIAYRAAPDLRRFNLDQLISFLVRHQLEALAETASDSKAGKLANLRSASVRAALDRRISRGFIAETVAGLARSGSILRGWSGRVRMGIVSNFYGNLAGILSESGLRDLFDAVADSGELGIYKPNPGIYQAALATLGADAAETTMVGDSLSKDCAPARTLGMRTVWLRHRDSSLRPDDHLHDADFTIDDLDELTGLTCLTS